MRLHYDPETDSLYIDLAERSSVESREVAPGVVADFDDRGKIVGIDIDRASRTVDLSRIDSTSLPLARDIVGDKQSKHAKTGRGTEEPRNQTTEEPRNRGTGSK